MFNVLKYEMIYHRYPWLILILATSLYTTFSLFDFQLTTSPLWEIDYWGALYSLIIYSYLISVWGKRINEKRVRMLNLLPITQNHNSLLRFSTAFLPYVFMIIYLVTIHLLIIERWHAETGSMIGQVGITLILFAGFVRGRDDWFSHWNFGKRFRAAFVSVLIIQIVVVFIFAEKPGWNAHLINNYGMEAFHYANLIFPLLGLIILITTFFSFRNRKSYLS
ncbi:MAG: hypothetical protein R3250_04265 [Melioribacteraceae bacterium]|nr:hypothetical protein [Melioribacteraceae bacterium]